ncbi:MAG TPA: hypothetical protein VLC91_02215 [Spongiibacteraceae bacterium]|nr:hypothetical protein [Spongiibacteraceae bacterium]
MNKLLTPWQDLASCDNDAISTQLDRLAINLRRTREECWLDFHYDNDRYVAPLTDEQPSLRFLLNHGDRPIRVTPLLADRPVVARPMVPTELLPKERTTLFISTVLWARVCVGEQLLAELATLRLSDTWFGATEMHGELCYASQTRALLRLDNVPYSAFRAIIPVTIDNQGEDNVKLERINVPVPHLTLYCDGEKFWTSALTILRETNLATAKLHIDATPPSGAVVIAQPRRPIRGGVFDRAVDLLFA